MSSAGYQYLTNTGVIVTDTVDLQTDVENEYIAAFGADMSTDPETPQGVLITAETLSRAEVLNNNAALANQINPNISGGIFLAAICALTGLEPPAATFSVVASPGVTLGGAASAFIPSGSVATDTNGNQWQTTSDVTIDPIALTGTTGVQALNPGAITLAISGLTTVSGQVLGWTTVTNTVAATPGQAGLSDQALRTLRNNTLALQGSTLAEAIQSAVADVPGVQSQTFLENIANTTQTISGVSLVAKSVWSCVNGGADIDVATALLTAKSGGCAWNGATSVNVTDPSSGQVYTVLFDRPTAEAIAVQMAITVPANTVNPATAATQAILDYANGVIPTQPGFVVGGDVSPFELAGAVMSEMPGVYVSNCEIKLVSSGSFSPSQIAIAINQIATIITANIAITVTIAS